MRLLFVLLAALPLFADGGACPARWGYDPLTNGPAWWGQMEVEWARCDTGPIQSPIDLGTAVTGTPAAGTINYGQRFPVTVQRTSHEIKVYPLAANTVMYLGDTYTLEQFHFHVPAEHRIGPTTHNAELHLVHKTSGTPQKALVLAVFIDEGIRNDALVALLGAAPTTSCTSAKLASFDRLSDLLPPSAARGRFYSYTGSLTTPECAEGIQFIVYAAAIQADGGQIEALKVLKDTGNARPIQPTGDRRVWKTAGTP